MKIVDRVDIFRLSNEELWGGLKALAARERVLAADAVAYVAETQRRRLHEDHGWRSMFEYCVQSPRWSEATAYRRTRAASAVIACPAILEMLYDGRLHVEGVVVLSAFLEAPDFPSLLLKAAGRTVKEIEWLVAERRAVPVKRDLIKVVGVRPAVAPVPHVEGALLFSSGGRPELPPPCPAKPPSPTPAAETRLFHFAFIGDETLQQMVLRARQLMRHKYPDGSLEGIFRDALRLLIEKKDLGVRAAAAEARRMRRKNIRLSGAIPS